MPRYKVTFSYTETQSYESHLSVDATDEDEAADLVASAQNVDNLVIEAVEELPDDPEATPTTEPTDG